MPPETPTTLRLTCSHGLAELLRAELLSLGFSHTDQHDSFVEIQGAYHDAMRLNLHLRTALAVLYQLAAFPCEHPDDLYQAASDYPWEDLVPDEAYVSVSARGHHPTVDNWGFPALRVKDAIVDRLVAARGKRPDTGPSKNGIVISVAWWGSRCAIFLNTSGVKLSDRGYRRLPHTAPMQETLAAGVLLATGYDGNIPLVNPMCGSGTLAIEAALIAANRAPGLLRANYSLMHTGWHDENAWQSLRREAGKSRRKHIPCPIIATDIDAQAIDIARKNAATAGVDHLVEFAVQDFAESPLPPPPGIVLMNPEYGERLGDVRKLEGVYKRIGDFFKQRCAGYTGFVFTGNKELSKRIGLRASRRIPFWNAKIECRLLKYDLYEGTRRKDKLTDENGTSPV